MEVPVVLFIAVLVVFAIGAYFSYLGDKKRREELAVLAGRLGLAFSEEHNSRLAEQYSFLDRLARGDNRYAFNVMSGVYREQRILAGDYHYETHSTDSKGNRQTHNHYLGFFILRLPLEFPELTIVREGLFSKIAQAFGYADIDFESHEFSRKFCVRSRDRKFAYDVCNARMIDYLLQNDDLSVEIERDAFAIVFENQLAAPDVEKNLGRLLALRSLLPDYLFTRISS